MTVQFPMMPAAERDGELIADLPAQRSTLGKAQMVRVARDAAADQARLLRHEPNVLPVAKASRFGEGERCLVDGGN